MSDKREIYHKMRHAMCQKKEDLTIIQEAVIFAHAMNIDLGLQCVNREGEKIQYPPEWREAKEGVYKFNYKHKNKIIQFRYVNNDGTVLYINFVPEDSDDLMKTQLMFEKEKIEDLIKFYQSQIKEKLLEEKKQEKKKSNTTEITNLNPVYRQPRQPQNPNMRPYVPLVPNNPYNSPFGQGQYVGPDSNIFQGGGGFRPMNMQGNRKPPGARFDPVDPFGNSSFDDDDQNNRDFSGFNQWGKPFGGGNGNNRPPFI